MRALVIREGGGLVVEDRPAPDPGDHDVLVRVAGAGINRADLLQRAGRYPAPPGAPPDIPGLEFAGVVEAPGPAAPRTSSTGPPSSAWPIRSWRRRASTLPASPPRLTPPPGRSTSPSTSSAARTSVSTWPPPPPRAGS